MVTTTIRISIDTRNVLHELAHEAGLSMQEVAERAIENYYRQQLLAAANAAYAALRADTDAWDEWQAEQASWDETLADGLEDY
jgi:predicted transcriptional regulator